MIVIIDEAVIRRLKTIEALFTATGHKRGVFHMPVHDGLADFVITP